MSAATGRPRVVRAENPSPLTLDGTRTHVVGRDPVAVIDPGPALPEHLNAVADLVGDGVRAFVLLTHDHPDHAAGAAVLAERLGAPLRSAASGTLAEGDVVRTDAGALHALATPGHTRDHVAFWWPEGDAAFVGDLMLGGTDTALVAGPEGHLGDYLRSLERIRALGAGTLYPAHGEPFADADAAIGRYLRHRRDRLAQARAAIAEAAPRALDLDGAVDAVYGGALPAELRAAARGAAEAYLEHLEELGEAERGPDGWSLIGGAADPA